MSGIAPDPLDRLEERAFHAATEGGEIFGEGWIPTLTIDVPTVLALVEVARAARDRYASGHNDWCDTQLSPESGYACTCGHAELAAALALLAENGATRYCTCPQPQGSNRYCYACRAPARVGAA